MHTTQTVRDREKPIGDLTTAALIAKIREIDAQPSPLPVHNDLVLVVGRFSEDNANGKVAWLTRTTDCHGPYWLGEGFRASSEVPGVEPSFDDAITDVEDLENLIRWVQR